MAVTFFLVGDSPAYENGTDGAFLNFPPYKIQTPGNHPKLRTHHLEHGGSLKSGKGFSLDNCHMGGRKLRMDLLS